jgi:hypothetical protein
MGSVVTEPASFTSRYGWCGFGEMSWLPWLARGFSGADTVSE